MGKALLGCALVFASEAKIEIAWKRKKTWFWLFCIKTKQQKSEAKTNGN
jgi:hypothetical protein